MDTEDLDLHELKEECLLDVPKVNVWRCWTEPKLLEKWFAPPDWKAEVLALDQHPGGASHITLYGPNGEVTDGIGVFLEIVQGERIVFTNTYTFGWLPADRPTVVPYMTTFIEMEDEENKTHYVVRALHWSEEAKRQHEEMGFHKGWKDSAKRLEATAQSLIHSNWHESQI